MGTCVVKRLAILGGTFDPVHVGHLRSALEVGELLGLDEVRLMPNALPPHRDMPSVSALQRLQMVQLAVANEPLLTVDARELQRDKPSWTIDTLISVRAELAAVDQLFFVLGWDALCGLSSWQRWRELLDYCHLLVLQRPDMQASLPEPVQALLAERQVDSWQQAQGPAGSIVFLQQTPLAVSATAIRQLLAEQKSIRFLVPDRVLEFIQTQGLYATV